jgi:hypothetical protein
MNTNTDTNTNDIENLYSKVYGYLVLKQNKLCSLIEIYNSLSTTYPEFNIRERYLREILLCNFETVFATITHKYENVYIINSNDKNYLVWSLNNEKNISDEQHSFQQDNSECSYDNEILNRFEKFSNKKFYEVNHISNFKKMIDDCDYSFIYTSNFIDGNLPIHLLIINNEFNIINKLAKLTCIDFSLKNKNGKNCLELAKEIKNCDLVELIVEKKYENELNELNDIKKNQIKTYTQIKECNKKINNMKIYKIINILIFLFWILTFIFNFKFIKSK